jgi:thiol-disulfide isomerase/thioredoxin
MNQENKNETHAGYTHLTDKKPTIRQRILSWLGFLAAAALILFIFAPESWWQFGVSPESERKPAAAFSLQEIKGGEWNFEDHRGRVVVVNYWATWCPPCRVETPGLVSFADEYKSRGVETIGVTVDEDLSLVPPFVEKYNIKYPILIAGANPNVPAGEMALPTTFLYDRNGRLAKKYTGLVLESTLKSDVEDLLKDKN